jgi:hypothetical protein
MKVGDDPMAEMVEPLDRIGIVEGRRSGGWSGWGDLACLVEGIASAKVAPRTSRVVSSWSSI